MSLSLSILMRVYLKRGKPLVGLHAVVACKSWSPAGVVPESQQVADAVGEDALLEGILSHPRSVC